MTLAVALGLHPLAVRACDQTLAPRFDADPQSGTSISVGRIADRVWRLRSIDGDPIPDTADVWLMVMPDGRVHGRAGCNRYAGQAELDAGFIGFGRLARTYMACDVRTMEFEAAYLARLAEVSGFVVGSDGALWLTRQDGSAGLCFGPA
ncbi:MAG: META domain-containing protein [Tabrizicola sp.]